MTPEQLEVHMALQDKKIATLTKYWASVLPTVGQPDRAQFALWLKMFDHDFDTVLYGISETAKKYQRLGRSMSQDHAVRFASKCASCFRKAGRTLRLPARKFVEHEYEVAA